MDDGTSLYQDLTRGGHCKGDALLASLTRGIDRFIPSRVRWGDVDVLRRARLIVTFGWTLFAMAIVFAAISMSIGNRASAVTHAVGAVTGLIGVCVFLQTGSCFVAGNVLAAVFFGVLTAAMCVVEGRDILTLPWYSAVPVVAVVTAGRRSGFAWLAATLLLLGTFYGLSCSGYTCLAGQASGRLALAYLVSLTFLNILMFCLAVMYETARNRALGELKEAEARLLDRKAFSDTVIASLPGIFALEDAEGKFVCWNEELERLSGYSRRELSRMQHLELFRGRDRETVALAHREALAKGQASAEACLITRDERAIPCVFYGRRVFLNRRPYMIGTGFDMTCQKEIRDALQASEEKFRQFAVASSSGIGMCSLTGGIVFVNAALLGMLEEESEDALIGKSLFQYHRPEDVQRLMREILPTVLEDGQWVGELPVVTARGHVIAAEHRFFLIRDEQRKFRMIGSIITDISQRKQAEAAMEKRLVALTRPLGNTDSITFEELFNLDDIQRLQDDFARATGVSSIITRTDGTPITAPSNFTRLCREIIRKTEKGCARCLYSDARLGRCNSEGPTVQACLSAGLLSAGAAISVGGKHIANWIIGQARDERQTEEEMRRFAREIEADEELVVEAFLEIPTMSRQRHAQVAQTLFTLANQLSDMAYQNIQQARFITERKRIEAELAEARDVAEAAARAKSQFLANMSHEIRTPMTAILGFSEILSGSVTDPRQADAVATIRRNGEYLLQIINDILDLSKIEAGKMDIDHVPCLPAQILREVVSLMRVRAEEKNLSLDLQFDGQLPRAIRSDPIRLRQILINLIGNAVKFTETGGVRVVAKVVDTGTDHPALEVAVIDTGIGMSEEQIVRVYQPFTQVDSSSTRRYGGTGLGLAISKRLAERLGGNIAIRSAPGKGATFTLTVAADPLEGDAALDGPCQPPPAAAGSPLSLEPLGPAGRCRVLLAEDGADNQRLIALLLRKAGIDVDVVDNGRDACDRALAAREGGSPFALILMDMQMPILDGYDATSRLRAAGYTGPIIAVTAHAMCTDRQKCLAAGCDDYLTKPIDRKQLVSLVLYYARQAGAHAREPLPIHE